jgi:hypothetical protein
MDKIISKYLSGAITYKEAIALTWPRSKEVCDKIVKIMEQRDRFLPNFKINSWLEQWGSNPEYSIYKAEDVECFVVEDKLFLIPLVDRKPIKLIIA